MLWGQRAILKVLKHACTKTFWFLPSITWYYTLLCYVVETEVLSETSKNLIWASLDAFMISWICWFIWCLRHFWGSLEAREEEVWEIKKWTYIKGFHQKHIFLFMVTTSQRGDIFHKSFFEPKGIKHINFNQKSFPTYCWYKDFSSNNLHRGV